MKKYLLRTAMIAALYACSHAASATVITYDFTTYTNSDLDPYKWFQGTDGSWVKATAQYANGSTDYTKGIGVVQGYGLYVCSESPCGSYDGNDQDRYPVDGDDVDEGVLFQFYESNGSTKQVNLKLLEAEFFVYDDHQNSYNAVDIRAGTSSHELIFQSNCTKTIPNYGAGSVYSCDFTTLQYSPSSLVNEFSFWADWYKDAFKIRKLTFDTPSTQVPEPTALALLGASLVGAFAAARLRRRRTS